MLTNMSENSSFPPWKYQFFQGSLRKISKTISRKNKNLGENLRNYHTVTCCIVPNLWKFQKSKYSNHFLAIKSVNLVLNCNVGMLFSWNFSLVIFKLLQFGGIMNIIIKSSTLTPLFNHKYRYFFAHLLSQFLKMKSYVRIVRMQFDINEKNKN